MQLEFTRGTDTEHEIKLESSLVSTAWRCARAHAAQTASVEVHTAFVGDGAPITIKLISAQDGEVGTLDGTVRSNTFSGEIDVPADLAVGDTVSFEAELGDHGLSGTSGAIPVLPAPRVTNLQWSAEEARRGDVVTLSADVAGVPDQSEIKLVIYEHDADSAHDRIIELSGTVEREHVEVRWEYEYHEDTDEIPTQSELERGGREYNPPEYFFTVKVGSREFGGEEQDSGLLRFKDWLEIELVDHDGTPLADRRYRMTLADGSVREGTLDAGGTARLEDIPPGPCRLEIADADDGDGNGGG